MMAGFESEIKNALRTGKITLGSKESLWSLKHGKARMVIVAANADPVVKRDVEHYAKLSSTPIYNFDGTSVDMGAVLGKPFPIQVIAVIDPGDSKILELVER